MEEKINKKELLLYLKKSWQFARKQKKTLILYFIASLLLSIISATIPMFAATQILRLSSGKFDELIYISVVVFLIEISRNLFRYIASRVGQIFFRETLITLQHELACQTLRLETKTIDTNSSGVFITRINKDAGDIADIYSQINDYLTLILANIGILITIFVINKYIFAYLILALIILYIFKSMAIKKYFFLDKEYRKLNEKNTGLITELVRGIRDIKVLNASEEFVNKMDEKFIESNKKRYQMNGVRRMFDFIAGSVQDVFTLVFIILGIYLVKNNMISISNLIILYMYQDRVYNLLGYIARLKEVLKNFSLSSKRVFEIIDNDTYKKEVFGHIHLSKINGDFEFQNVTFSYTKELPIIKDISFKIKANETVAFVGKSGSGKTTIFNLLAKLYNIDNGKILIDNIDINKIDEYSLRNNISIITQSPYIFNFSIRDNLKIVKGNITDKEMIKACKLACFHDFVMTLPDKYDTLVGEGGVTLSGGQRQRLAIARALLKKSEIILFDEATSALDNETQQSIQQAINNMKGEYTILIIAHRLSTVINSNRIIVIDEGKVAAEGTHAYLLENNSLYRKLYEQELSEGTIIKELI